MSKLEFGLWGRSPDGWLIAWGSALHYNDVGDDLDDDDNEVTCVNCEWEPTPEIPGVSICWFGWTGITIIHSDLSEVTLKHLQPTKRTILPPKISTFQTLEISFQPFSSLLLFLLRHVFLLCSEQGSPNIIIIIAVSIIIIGISIITIIFDIQITVLYLYFAKQALSYLGALSWPASWYPSSERHGFVSSRRSDTVELLCWLKHCTGLYSIWFSVT